MNYTDTQLKLALEKMLPEKIIFRQFTEDFGYNSSLYWKNKNQFEHQVLDTELPYLCWLAEEEIFRGKSFEYIDALKSITLYNDSNYTHATWKQRVEALAKVKGIEI